MEFYQLIFFLWQIFLSEVSEIHERQTYFWICFTSGVLDLISVKNRPILEQWFGYGLCCVVWHMSNKAHVSTSINKIWWNYFYPMLINMKKLLSSIIYYQHGTVLKPHYSWVLCHILQYLFSSYHLMYLCILSCWNRIVIHMFVSICTDLGWWYWKAVCVWDISLHLLVKKVIFPQNTYLVCPNCLKFKWSKVNSSLNFKAILIHIKFVSSSMNELHEICCIIFPFFGCLWCIILHVMN